MLIYQLNGKLRAGIRLCIMNHYKRKLMIYLGECEFQLSSTKNYLHVCTRVEIHTYKLFFHLIYILKIFKISLYYLLFSLLVALPLVVHTIFHELLGSGKSWLIDENVKIMMGLYFLQS